MAKKSRIQSPTGEHIGAKKVTLTDVIMGSEIFIGYEIKKNGVPTPGVLAYERALKANAGSTENARQDRRQIHAEFGLTAKALAKLVHDTSTTLTTRGSTVPGMRGMR